MKIFIALGATIWPVLGIASIPVVSAVLAAFIAYYGITTRIALIGLAVTLGGSLLAGLPLASQALPWLITVALMVFGESFLALAPQGVVRIVIVGFVVFLLLEMLTIVGIAVDAGFLIHRLANGFTEYRIGSGALVLLAVVTLLHWTDSRPSR